MTLQWTGGLRADSEATCWTIRSRPMQHGTCIMSTVIDRTWESSISARSFAA